jgi:hypothetical protein
MKSGFDSMTRIVSGFKCTTRIESGFASGFTGAVGIVEKRGVQRQQEFRCIVE